MSAYRGESDKNVLPNMPALILQMQSLHSRLCQLHGRLDTVTLKVTGNSQSQWPVDEQPSEIRSGLIAEMENNVDLFQSILSDMEVNIDILEVAFVVNATDIADVPMTADSIAKRYPDSVR